MCVRDVIKSSHPTQKSHLRFYPHQAEELLTLYLFTTFQLSSSYVWELAHFEFRSHRGSWHKAKIAFAENCTLISLIFAILEVKNIRRVLV